VCTAMGTVLCVLCLLAADNTHKNIPSAVHRVPPDDEQKVIETCGGY
jgi:hypothetical protein